MVGLSTSPRERAHWKRTRALEESSRHERDDLEEAKHWGDLAAQTRLGELNGVLANAGIDVGEKKLRISISPSVKASMPSPCIQKMEGEDASLG